MAVIPALPQYFLGALTAYKGAYLVQIIVLFACSLVPSDCANYSVVRWASMPSCLRRWPNSLEVYSPPPSICRLCTIFPYMHLVQRQRGTTATLGIALSSMDSLQTASAPKCTKWKSHKGASLLAAFSSSYSPPLAASALTLPCPDHVCKV